MRAPRVEAHSAVGAGDSFVGAITLALSRGSPMDDALTFAIAAGAASVLHPGTHLCSTADVLRIYDDIKAGRAGHAIEKVA
jgi:6-phosphofructokinase 2